MRFSRNDWADGTLLADGTWAEGDGPAFEYHFELERHAGIPAVEHPHFLAYRAPKANDDPAELVWDSARADTLALKMNPGELTDLQWIFTRPGTYTISVHLRASVRTGWSIDEQRPQGWERISDSEIEASEVKRYVFHVGSELTVNRPPAFLVERSVAENSAIGTAVGEAIPVHDPDGDPLSYRLSGPGSDLFALSGARDGSGRFTEAPRIVTATNTLDHEARSSYLLTLFVSDGKGITDYPDRALDNAIRVSINVTDVDEVDVGSKERGLRLVPSATRLKVGEPVTLRAVVGDLPAGATNPVLRWNVEDPPGADPHRSGDTQEYSRTYTYDTPGSRTFYVGLLYTSNRTILVGHRSHTVTVTWHDDADQ